MLLFVTPSHATAEEAAKTEVEEAETVRGQSIDGGYVLLNGRYQPPPYVIAQRGHDLLINDHLISVEGFAKRSRGDQGPEEYSADRPKRRRGTDQRNLITRVERHLDNDDLLIVVEDELVAFLPEPRGWIVFDILLSDAPAERKSQLLVDEEFERIESEQWARIVQSFEPTPELTQRVLPLVEKYKAAVEVSEAAHRRLVASAFFLSKPVRYVATVAVLVVVVMAMGNLLNYRPENRGRWRDIDGSADSMAMVVRNVVLLVVFGAIDLLLTLTAQQAGGFLELNPLGGRLLESPLLLATFKMTSLLAACLILVSLRRYRGAQIASWWMCLACTVLTFRWLTYNSLFLT
jgi:hypothetical protein